MGLQGKYKITYSAQKVTIDYHDLEVLKICSSLKPLYWY